MAVLKGSAPIHAAQRVGPPLTLRPPVAVLGAVALISATGLIWEITLTRVASVVLSYHFAFVAVSLAIVGLGLGAALVYALSEHRAWAWAVPSVVGAALLFPVVALASPEVVVQSIGPVLVALATLPFLVLGVALAAVFRRYARAATLVYGADLTGAGVGAAISAPILNLVGPFGAILLLGAACAASALLLRATLGSTRSDADTEVEPDRLRLPYLTTPIDVNRSSRLATLSAALLLLNLGGLVVQVARAPLAINYASLTAAPPDKTIVGILRDPAQHAQVVETRWDAYARTDVVATADPSRRYVFTDGGGGTIMLHWNGQLPAQSARLNDLETVPFLLGPHSTALVIGAGGGVDVVRALVAGAHQVTAIELNAATVAAVRAERAYNGNVLDRPGVTTVVDDGRHYLARTQAHYDVILLNLVYSGAAEGTGHALDESYIFTTEAFQSYLQHLTPHGRIAIIAHQGLEGTRAFLTALAAQHSEGLSYRDALLRSTLLMTNNDNPEARPTLAVISRSPLAQPALNLLRTRGNSDLNLQPLYVPYYYGGGFKEMQSGTQSLDTFLQGSDYAVGPTTDNQPFFFDLNLGLPDGLATALWLAGLVAAGVVALVFFLREGPDAEANRRAGALYRRSGAIWWLGGTMTLLGVGFMCLEVPLIQRFILILGQPVLAFTVVLTTLLLAGGVGSLLGARLFTDPARTPFAPLAVAALALVSVSVFGLIAAPLLALPPAGTMVISALLLLPLGLALGLPFPLILRLAARLLPGDVALLWSLNALFSVLGSLLAATIAIQVGFGAVVLVGAACYLLCAALLWRMVSTLRPLPAE